MKPARVVPFVIALILLTLHCAADVPAGIFAGAITSSVAPSRVYVSKNGNGQYTTISDAVRASPAGTPIYIRPGIYDEQINIGKSLDLIGEGPSNKILIKGRMGDAIAITGAKVNIRGITVTGAKDGISLAGTSNVTITDCEIYVCIQHGLLLPAAGGSAILVKCKFHDCGDESVIIGKNSRVSLAECDVAGSRYEHPCIYVVEGCLSLQSTTIHNSRVEGIVVDNSSHLIMLNSEVSNSGWEGLYVGKQSFVTVNGSRFKSNHYSGIRINSAMVEVDDCDVTDNGEAGADVRLGSLSIDHSRVTHNGHQGDWVRRSIYRQGSEYRSAQ